MNEVTENTKELIGLFLETYKKGSQANYISAINVMLKDELAKNDPSKLTIEDYKQIEAIYSKATNKTQLRYRQAFFRYLFAFDFLDNPDGFSNLWLKHELVKRYEQKLKKNREIKEYKPALTFEEIDKIETLMSKDYSDNMEMLKMSFIWFMLFHTDCEVMELKNEIDSSCYSDGNIVTPDGNEYIIPERYDSLFRYLNRRAHFTGFNTSGDIIDKLGRLVGIKLKPQTVKNARKQNLIKCFMCGEMSLALLNEWKGLNDRLICNACFKNVYDIKKNQINSIGNYFIDFFTDEEKIDISSVINTFEELKKQLNHNIDYTKLHELFMEIGKLGEAFVYESEKKKHITTKYYELIDNTPALNPKNGYDILSYDDKGNKIHIEVKTTSTIEDDFLITVNEISRATEIMEKGMNYYIYRVKNIFAKNTEDIEVEIVKNIFDGKYKLEPSTYRATLN